MRVQRAVGILLLSSLAPGCSLASIAGRNLSNEAALYKDDCIASVQLSRLAEETWQSVCGGSPFGRYSSDYAAGFKDGFVDFVDAGGVGEPPPVPPKRYQRLQYQTPQGWQVAEDWFAGF